MGNPERDYQDVHRQLTPRRDWLRTTTRRQLLGLLVGGAFCLFALADLIHFLYWLNRAGESADGQVETVIGLLAWAALGVAAFIWGYSER